jgi:DNA-binding CsgD family transcriptional regulator
MTDASGELVGRDNERRRIADAIAGACEGRASAIVLAGEAGIGKSRLLDYAEGLGERLVVARTRGLQAEFQLSYSALRDILAPLSKWCERITPHQAEVLTGILTLGSPGGGDRFAVAASYLNLMAAAAEDEPVLVLVDDAHWVDDASLEVLAFVARRLRGERVVMLFATRLPPTPAPVTAESQLSSLDTLTLGGLEVDEAQKLLSAMGRPQLGSSTLEEVVARTGGNPLALIEMSGPWYGSDPSGPVAVGPRLATAFGERLKFLSGQARATLLVLACAATADSDAIPDALSALSLDVAHLDDAERAGLVFVSAGKLSFTHPLVRSAVYHLAAPPERRAAHRALAEALSGRSHPVANERRCLHLAAGAEGFNDSVASQLELLATDAVERGAYATALQAFEQSALLTSHPEQRGRRMLQAAGLAQPAGRVDRAEWLLDQVDEVAASSPRLRRQAALVRCRVEMWKGLPVKARDRTLQLARSAEKFEPLQAAYMLANAGLTSAYLGELRLATETLERASGLLQWVPAQEPMPLEGQVTTTSISSIVSLVRAVILAIGGRAGEARSLLAEAGPWLDTWDPLSPGSLLLVGALAYFSLEDTDASRRLFERADHGLRAANALGLLPFQLSWRAVFEWRCGSWHSAYGFAHEGLSMARETGWATELPHALAVAALVEGAMGREDDCRAHTAEAIELATATGAVVVTLQADHALALLELDRDPRSAANRLERIGDFAMSNGMGDPVLLPWASDLAEACVRAGEPERAKTAAETVRTEAANSGRPTEWALAHRVAAIMGTSDDAEADLLEALAWHQRTTNAFETARTRLALGEHLRRRKRKSDARAQLRDALAVFERLGARHWISRTRAELAATGDREGPRRDASIEQLTPQELQVALRAAQGAPNTEIAAQLFLSAKTVEYHLTHVYRKLGLRSRSQLSRALMEASDV